MESMEMYIYELYRILHGKESTEVRNTQKMGKERENSHWKVEISRGKAHRNMLYRILFRDKS